MQQQQQQQFNITLTWPNATSHDEAISWIQHTHKYKIFTYKASSPSSSHPPLSLYKRVPKHLTIQLPFKTRIATHRHTQTEEKSPTQMQQHCL
jgi:hypothetical protein